MSNAAALEAARTQAESAAAVQTQQAAERKRREEVEAVFRMMDTNNDGYLSIEEARRLGKLLGIALPERHSVHVKGVSLHQFMGWVFGLSKVSAFESTVLQFYIFIKDRKGFVGRKALQEWMGRNHLDCTEAELDELMEIMNTSNDDRGVCYDDLLQFYNNNIHG